MTELFRRLALSHQGLISPPKFGLGLSGTLQAIRHLGYVQIDTISVVERAHHHILWSRVPDYQSHYLNQLVQQQHIFEYWFHVASYLPIQDYRYALPHMTSVRNGEHRYFNRGDQHLMNEILAKTRAEGSIRLRHIEQGNRSNSGGWWNSSSARRSIDQLFMQGDLMICERNGMEKVYNLTERCLPSQLDLSMPTLEEYARYLFNTTLRAHGIFTWKQLLHLKVGSQIREAMRQIVNEQLEAGVIITLSQLGYTDKESPNIYIKTEALAQKPHRELEVKILSPFDNLVIHRERLRTLFNFDYRLECYVTPAKRSFGYFCLPILYADQIVGRIDCKAHRAQKQFEVLSLHLEDHCLKNKEIDHAHLLNALNNELHRFAQFNQCPQIKNQPNQLFKQVVKQLS
ncbi:MULTISPECIES: crosslink repair DNA glycosylase YcaQ family protein [unclassified Acinetobacter]|uniref:winged helix-turn-helix domain-containing protein n=1 Tax=unclassified Acinetobacter TaxID=196816 RepID=UPI0018A90680|nr:MULTISPECIES: crosslink repair DNA glycosylase YcaQ family protein [unclassified Acinetobacter]MBJ9953473.1 YcaQ family DNA glycosylase [Acinetobacter baumannii]